MIKWLISVLEWLAPMVLAFFNGKQQAELDHAKESAVATSLATKQRDEIDDETRKIPDTAIDAELHALGVLRD